MKRFIFLSLFSLIAGCSPLKTSPHDEKHQMELTLHEVQTNLDDLRHDIHCFKTELQIVDSRICQFESSKLIEPDKIQAKLDHLSQQIQNLEKKWISTEKTRESKEKELNLYANETTAALIQCKSRTDDLEKVLTHNQKRFEEIAKLKSKLETLIQIIQSDEKTYKVKMGDTLEKIAKTYQTSVEKIKSMNHLQNDIIVIGQELKIPSP